MPGPVLGWVVCFSMCDNACLSLLYLFCLSVCLLYLFVCLVVDNDDTSVLGQCVRF